LVFDDEEKFGILGNTKSKKSTIKTFRTQFLQEFKDRNLPILVGFSKSILEYTKDFDNFCIEVKTNEEFRNSLQPNVGDLATYDANELV
jgi:hypothetical protein